jgi:hypothetical protein
MFEKTSDGSVAGTNVELDCDGGSGSLDSKMLHEARRRTLTTPERIHGAFARTLIE